MSMTKRSATVLIAFTLALLGVRPGSEAQDSPFPITSSGGCKVFVGQGTAQTLSLPFASGGTILLQNAKNGNAFTFDFDGIDFPPTPADSAGLVLHSVSIVNWRFRENGVRGTTRAETTWLLDPDHPTQARYQLYGEVIRGNRFGSGGTYAEGLIDLAAGTYTVDVFMATLCRDLE